MTTRFHLRRAGQVSGPFTRGMLLRDRTLGRALDTDEVSVDGEFWLTIADCRLLDIGVVDASSTAPAIDQAWAEERERAHLRWLDERTQPDRRQAPGATPHEGRSGRDRRANPAPPARHFGPVDAPPEAHHPHLRFALFVVLIVAVAGALLWWFVPRQTPRIRLTTAPADLAAISHRITAPHRIAS